MEESQNYIDLDGIRSSWREGLLVLMYHAIETPPRHQPWRALYVEPSKLRSQLKELQASGARFVSLSDWNHHRSDERQVAVTFDDGFQNVLRQGLPVLRELGVPSINFIVAGLIGQTNSWDGAGGAQVRPLMGRSEINDWLQAGQEIGSHTVTHRDLTLLSPKEARREIIESKKILEDISNRPIRHFSYPYGKSNPVLHDWVREAGYETACSTEGGYNLKQQNSHTLRRLLARHRRPYAVAWGRAALNLLLLKSPCAR